MVLKYKGSIFYFSLDFSLKLFVTVFEADLDNNTYDVFPVERQLLMSAMLSHIPGRINPHGLIF